MSLKFITFDLDDTLWDNSKVIDLATINCFSWLCHNYPNISNYYCVESLTKLKDEIQATTAKYKHQLTLVRVKSIELALLDAGYSREMAREGAINGFDVFHVYRNEVKLYSGVVKSLNFLSKKYDLAALTNGNIDFKKLSIIKYFKFVLSAEEIDSSKPEPYMFNLALEKNCSRPNETLHFGDSPVNDIIPAQKLGINTVWFNPSKEPWPYENKPTHEVKSIEELVAFTKTL